MENTDIDETVVFSIVEAEAGERLDKILTQRYKEIRSRTYFQQLLADGHVLLNGQPVKKRVQPKVGDEVEVTFVLTPEIDLTPEPMVFDILYEDDHVLAINKPAGMVVHPAPGNWSGTFVNGLLYHCKGLESSGEASRPGIVHRLDKDTTGVLLAAKTVLAHQRLVEQFSGRTVHKEYLAICVGNPGEGEIRTQIGRDPRHRKMMAVLEEGGRLAVTRCKTLAVTEDRSLVRIELITGRTHQARVHMRYRGAPVLGDPIYGSPSANKRYSVQRQMLHAESMQFTHPMTGAPIKLLAPLPADMRMIVGQIAPGTY